MSSTASAVSYAAAAARPPSPAPAKYVPVHKRTPSDTTLVVDSRSSSPVPSETPLSHSRVYDIAALLHLAQEPEVKLISVVQKERVKQVMPEIVMSRKMRKGMEYHAIQERMRVKAALAQTPLQSQPPPPQLQQQQQQPQSPTALAQHLRQRPGQRRQGRPGGTDRRRNATKVVDEASWRALRPARTLGSGAPPQISAL